MTLATSAVARDAYVSAGDLRFHYREWGDAAAPTVLLLHGLTGNAWEWDPIAAALAPRFHVLALDQRGHGATDWAGDYAARRMVEDVAALALGPLTIVGHSMGGLNAFLLAAERPDLVERLAIVDFGPDSLTPEACAGWTAYLHAAAQASYADADEALAEWQAMNSRARERELRHFIVHNLAERPDGRWTWRFDAAGLHSFLEQTPDEATLWAALRRVACPLLLIHGRHSEVLSAKTAARMAHELRDCRLVEVSDGAHDLTVEQPAALSAAIGAFLTAR